ncbi:hypothetical protein ANN_21955 [Periplaneta americana]|uniref:Uncharacterized protein n=1 Tax=Periplaneta americana TaxID=6978 RepID=A0ABQ8S796_PERAM|nr:hypothetical protein ANN_21955 [Periplaneta americana]
MGDGPSRLFQKSVRSGDIQIIREDTLSKPVNRASQPVLCTGVRLECASATVSASEGLSSSAVDRSWRDLSSSTVDCLSRSVVRDTVNSSAYYYLSRAVASWSKTSCLGLALRNASWFESSRGKKFSHEISASVWDRCPPSIVMHLGSYDRSGYKRKKNLLVNHLSLNKSFYSRQLLFKRRVVNRIEKKTSPGISQALRNKSFEVHEEVHCVASEGGGIRRADIVALDKTNSKGFILDPTVRFEMSQTQPSEVNKEKQQIYEPTIPYFREKYQMEGTWEVHGLMIGARGTIPRSTVNTIKTFGIHDIIPKIITSTIKGADKNSIKHTTMRVLLFQTIAPGIPLPPQPVLTLWKTWLDAVNYYAEYYGKIMEVIDALDSTDGSAVAAVKSLPSEQLLEDILFIDSNFKIVSKSITLLESSKLQLSEGLNIVYNVSQTVIQYNTSLISEKVKYIERSGRPSSTTEELKLDILIIVKDNPSSSLTELQSTFDVSRTTIWRLLRCKKYS